MELFKEIKYSELDFYRQLKDIRNAIQESKETLIAMRIDIVKTNSMTLRDWGMLREKYGTSPHILKRDIQLLENREAMIKQGIEKLRLEKRENKLI